MALFRSVTLGWAIWPLLNVSSWRVRAAARSPAYRISSAKRRRGTGSGYLRAQQVAVSSDDGQEIVEIARHAAGQAAHGVHFARVAQLFLELAAAGNIAKHQDGALQTAALIAQRRGALLDGDFGFVARHQQHLPRVMRGGLRPDGIPGGAAGGFPAAFLNDPQDLPQGLAHSFRAPPSSRGLRPPD